MVSISDILHVCLSILSLLYTLMPTSLYRYVDYSCSIVYYCSNGSATEHIFFGETVCRGDELELIECETDIHNKDLCGHQNIVWITCCKFISAYHEVTGIKCRNKGSITV